MIQLQNVEKRYSSGDNQVQALQPFNLTVNEGEFIAIMGSSGSGKSTVMNIIGCLDTPSQGKYFLDGKEVQALNETELAMIRNRKIGFVFQNFNLLPRQTILRNVELPMLYGGLSKAERVARAIDLLKKVGLADRLTHRPNELSGGQRQRVAIARALAMKPQVLLADEPTGNLDSKSSSDIMELFTKLNNEGTTIIIVTHEIDIADYTKRILRFTDGVLLVDRLNDSREARE
jgi:putative ABC transport system ATP-binding protein